MKLGTRVLLILSCMWIFVSLLVYLTSETLLRSRFEKLEQHQIVSDLGRVKQAFDTLKRSLALLSSDWGQWDDLYNYMQKKNEKFVKTNLDATTFQNAKINVILFFDNKNKFYNGWYYDLDNKMKFLPLPKELPTILLQQNAIRGITQKNNVRKGMILTPQGYFIFSASAILRSNGTGPVAGTVLMGYFVRQHHVQALSGIVNLPITLYFLPPKTDNPAILAARKALEKNMVYVQPVNTHQINGFALVRDINQKPIGMVRITVGRVLFNEGIMTLQYYLLSLVGIGIIMLVSLWFLLKYFVLDRLISVSNQVISFSENNNFAGRIQTTGRDELAQMVSALNSLIEIIDITQEQLKSRIIQHSEQLDRLSVLNKNLFGEINRQRAAERKKQEDEKLLQRMAYYDDLTGLPNRMFFNELLSKAIQKSANSGAGIAVIFMDADKFKQINDTYGHEAGDTFLKITAKRLKSVIKDSDVVGRYSGDEFVIFLANAKEKVIINLIAEKIILEVSKPVKLTESTEIPVFFSMGISIYPEDGATVETLIQHADAAMYYAKRKHGNFWCYSHSTDLFQPATHQQD